MDLSDWLHHGKTNFRAIRVFEEPSSNYLYRQHGLCDYLMGWTNCLSCTSTALNADQCFPIMTDQESSYIFFEFSASVCVP